MVEAYKYSGNKKEEDALAFRIHTEGRTVSYDERAKIAMGDWDMLFALENISFDDYMFYRFNLPVDMIKKEVPQKVEESKIEIKRAEEMKSNTRVKSTPLVSTGLSIISANTSKKTLKAPSE